MFCLLFARVGALRRVVLSLAHSVPILVSFTLSAVSYKKVSLGVHQGEFIVILCVTFRAITSVVVK